MSGGATHGQSENSKELHSSSEKQVPKPLGTIIKLPEHWRGLEVAGGAPVTKNRTGAEEDDAEKTA